MEENQKNGVQQKVDMLDYISILMKWKRFIFINVLAVSILAVIVSLLLPKWYKATASILPPKQQDMLGSIGAASSVLKSLAGSARISGLSQKSGAYNYIAILKSRSAMEAVARKFDLMTVYEISDSSMERTLKALKGNTMFEVQDEENITIDVYDRSPQRAADMANYFVEVLNNISIQLGTQEARNNRDFIEKRLADSKEDLRLAEEELRKYQEKSGVMMVPEENAGSLAGIAELYASKAKKEIELAILKKTVTGESAMIRQLEVELNELNRKVGTLPRTGLESFRLFRNAAIQQKIVEFLTPLYEQARIDEQKDVPVLLVLDKAAPPEIKVKPQRFLICLSAFFLSLFLAILLVYIMEGLSNRSGDLRPLEAKLRVRALRTAALYRVKVDA